MKILHAADLHLDTPFVGRPEAQAHFLRQQLLKIPGKLSGLCRREECDLVLLSGDLFDGQWTLESLDALRTALAEMAVPVFISPGNHDFCSPDSPYLTESWPGNVHIFTSPEIRSVTLEALDCKVYGAGYDSMDCPALLEGFRAEGEERYHIAVLHGDPTQKNAPYCPITTAQVQESGLNYLALGHIHKGSVFRAGETLCAWPGCPMGRGYDELEEKGALIVTLGAIADARFVALDGPRFFDCQVEAGDDPKAALRTILPALGNEDFYRISLTGEAEAPDLTALREAFSRFPHLELRDRTVPIVDIWSCTDEDTLEGVYFRTLKEAMADASEEERRALELAARISRQILDGREVSLP